jgi:hypothetical protein
MTGPARPTQRIAHERSLASLQLAISRSHVAHHCLRHVRQLLARVRQNITLQHSLAKNWVAFVDNGSGTHP